MLAATLELQADKFVSEFKDALSRRGTVRLTSREINESAFNSDRLVDRVGLPNGMQLQSLESLNNQQLIQLLQQVKTNNLQAF